MITFQIPYWLQSLFPSIFFPDLNGGLSSSSSFSFLQGLAHGNGGGGGGSGNGISDGFYYGYEENFDSLPPLEEVDLPFEDEEEEENDETGRRRRRRRRRYRHRHLIGKDWYVFHPIFGVIPMEMRDRWIIQEKEREDYRRRLLRQSKRILPPVRYSHIQRQLLPQLQQQLQQQRPQQAGTDTDGGGKGKPVMKNGNHRSNEGRRGNLEHKGSLFGDSGEDGKVAGEGDLLYGEEGGEEDEIIEEVMNPFKGRQKNIATASSTSSLSSIKNSNNSSASNEKKKNGNILITKEGAGDRKNGKTISSSIAIPAIQRIPSEEDDDEDQDDEEGRESNESALVYEQIPMERTISGFDAVGIE